MRLFISYAHVDVYPVGQLVEVLREAGYEPWFDHKLMPGMDWKAELLKAITVCEAFLYALTPEAVASEWCQWEFAQAVQMGKPVIPVLMQAKTPLPEAISRYQYADFSGGPTPQGVARLLGGLNRIAVVVPRQQALAALVNPQGTPAQAVEARAGAVHEPPLQMPPDVSHILPPPFGWCEIPAGWVTLEDASDSKNYDPPGTKGGKFHVKKFWMAKYPITNAQYRVFENDEDGYINPAWWDYSEGAKAWRNENPAPEDTAFHGNDLPRTNVCWYEAVAFCRWLNAGLLDDSARAGQVQLLQITLPTEQQWQRAAQGDDGRAFPWGNKPDAHRCNTLESGIGQPTSVLQYPNGASSYGVCDLIGNVREWCLTGWQRASDNIAVDFSLRAVRGGVFDQPLAPVTARIGRSLNEFLPMRGIRVVSISK